MEPSGNWGPLKVSQLGVFEAEEPGQSMGGSHEREYLEWGYIFQMPYRLGSGETSPVS